MNYMDLDINLNDHDRALKETAHKFAKMEMRSAARELDRMTAEEVIAPSSPLWDFLKQAYRLGYHKILIPESYGGLNLTSLQQILLFEELSWDSAGLTVLLAVASFPAFLGSLVPEEEIINDIIVPYCECQDGGIRGCWAITEPNHGSDTLVPGYPSFSDPAIPADCRARLDGDEWVIQGQKSAWVSGGSIATIAALYCQIDPSLGHAGSGIFLVPLDRPGVSRGKPLEKMGQRELNQGEIFFDEVRIPASYLIAGPEAYEAMLEISLSTSTCVMGALGTGIARAAFEETMAYARQRVQGGNPLVEYTHTRMRLFHMLRRVEAARQLTRAAYVYNQNTSTPAEEYSNFAKIQGTEAAFHNTHEAIQTFGGYGLTKEYLIEKLFRDARTSMIEDGSNDTLALAAGHKIMETYPRFDR